MNPGLLFTSLPIAGIVIGLLRVRYRRLPWIAAGLVVLAYLLYFAVYGTYAAQCWRCDTGFERRGDTLLISGLFLGLIAVVTLAGIALGARLTVVLGRLFGAARDVRDELRQRGGEDRPPVA